MLSETQIDKAVRLFVAAEAGKVFLYEECKLRWSGMSGGQEISLGEEPQSACASASWPAFIASCQSGAVVLPRHVDRALQHR